MTISSDDKLPELNDALLDSSELAALFRDYRACAAIDEIIVKSKPGYVSSDSSPTLDEAEKLLQSGAVRGVQVRYQFEGSAWCDTLLPFPTGVRLVRIQQRPSN